MPKPFIPIKDKYDNTDWYSTLVKNDLFDKLEENGVQLGLSQISIRGELGPMAYFFPNRYTFHITPKDIIVKRKPYDDFYTRLENNAETLRLLRKYTSMDVENL